MVTYDPPNAVISWKTLINTPVWQNKRQRILVVHNDLSVLKVGDTHGRASNKYANFVSSSARNFVSPRPKVGSIDDRMTDATAWLQSIVNIGCAIKATRSPEHKANITTVPDEFIASSP
jgi:hypothetical protein